MPSPPPPPYIFLSPNYKFRFLWCPREFIWNHVTLVDLVGQELGTMPPCLPESVGCQHIGNV